MADIKRQAEFKKTFLPSAKAQIRVLNQSYHVSLVFGDFIVIILRILLSGQVTKQSVSL